MSGASATAGQGGRASTTAWCSPSSSTPFPTQTSISLNAEASYNWDRRQLTMPINLTVSQLVLLGGQPVQFGLGGRNFAAGPANAPDWGIRGNMTLVFPR